MLPMHLHTSFGSMRHMIIIIMEVLLEKFKGSLLEYRSQSILLILNVQITMMSSTNTGPRSAVGNVSGNRCESDCRSRGRESDPGPVPYFRGV